MRLLFLIVAFLNWCFLSHSQKVRFPIIGTVAIDDSSAIDITEVTIQEYCYFLINQKFDPVLFPDSEKLSAPERFFFEELKRGESCNLIKIQKQLPHLAASYGEKGFEVTKVYKEYFKKDTSGFSIFNPVTGISFEQAEAFCRWRELNENKNRTIPLRITLPPKEVYETLIENTDSVLLQKKGCDRFRLNYAHPVCEDPKQPGDLQQQGIGPVRADRYHPTKKGLYCIQGNAAEMTSAKGIAAGGSYHHPANASFNTQTQVYMQAERWLGFRCYISVHMQE